MMEPAFWQFILNRLLNSEPVILLCVVESHGSSPGRQGFKMAVAGDGMFGSIGGGVMEHNFVDLAVERLRSENAETLIRRQFHNKSTTKDQSGMICSGNQTNVIFLLTAKDVPTITAVQKAVQEHSSGTLWLTPSAIDFHNESSVELYSFEMKDESNWIYRERIGFKNHLYIMGGGHCSYALSKLMSSMDFCIHIYEDRKDLNTFLSNEYANEKIIVDDYSKLAEVIQSGENNYVVIMTFGYKTDDVALRSLINKDFKYLGVLGSKAKMSRLMTEWKRDNLPEEKLKALHAPVGISINSQTPEEIAVSIVAEIIRVKNDQVHKIK